MIRCHLHMHGINEKGIQWIFSKSYATSVRFRKCLASASLAVPWFAWPKIADLRELRICARAAANTTRGVAEHPRVCSWSRPLGLEIDIPCHIRVVTHCDSHIHAFVGVDDDQDRTSIQGTWVRSSRSPVTYPLAVLLYFAIIFCITTALQLLVPNKSINGELTYELYDSITHDYTWVFRQSIFLSEYVGQFFASSILRIANFIKVGRGGYDTREKRMYGHTFTAKPK